MSYQVSCQVSCQVSYLGNIGWNIGCGWIQGIEERSLYSSLASLASRAYSQAESFGYKPKVSAFGVEGVSQREENIAFGFFQARCSFVDGAYWLLR